jgi:hypothetical protein
VAIADIIIAFTWGDDERQPKDGGTADTWRKSNTREKIHIPLRQLANSTWKPRDAQRSLDFMIHKRKLEIEPIDSKKKK